MKDVLSKATSALRSAAASIGAAAGGGGVVEITYSFLNNSEISEDRRVKAKERYEILLPELLMQSTLTDNDIYAVAQEVKNSGVLGDILDSLSVTRPEVANKLLTSLMKRELIIPDQNYYDIIKNDDAKKEALANFVVRNLNLAAEGNSEGLDRRFVGSLLIMESEAIKQAILLGYQESKIDEFKDLLQGTKSQVYVTDFKLPGSERTDEGPLVIDIDYVEGRDTVESIQSQFPSKSKSTSSVASAFAEMGSAVSGFFSGLPGLRKTTPASEDINEVADTAPSLGAAAGGGGTEDLVVPEAPEAAAAPAAPKSVFSTVSDAVGGAWDATKNMFSSATKGKPSDAIEAVKPVSFASDYFATGIRVASILDDYPAVKRAVLNGSISDLKSELKRIDEANLSLLVKDIDFAQFVVDQAEKSNDYRVLACLQEEYGFPVRLDSIYEVYRLNKEVLESAETSEIQKQRADINCTSLKSIYVAMLKGYLAGNEENCSFEIVRDEFLGFKTRAPEAYDEVLNSLESDEIEALIAKLSSRVVSEDSTDINIELRNDLSDVLKEHNRRAAEAAANLEDVLAQLGSAAPAEPLPAADRKVNPEPAMESETSRRAPIAVSAVAATGSGVANLEVLSAAAAHGAVHMSNAAIMAASFAPVVVIAVAVISALLFAARARTVSVAEEGASVTANQTDKALNSAVSAAAIVATSMKLPADSSAVIPPVAPVGGNTGRGGRC